MRYYLKKTERITKDIDVVVATKQLDEFHKLLELESYKVGNFDPWFRAIKEFRGNKIILDFTGENVVELNNYNSLKLNFNSFVRKRVRLKDGRNFYIPLPKLEVLILLKLLSRREKDTIDVLLILLEKYDEIDFIKYQEEIQLQDIERVVYQGYLAVQDFIHSKSFLDLWQLNFDTRITPDLQKLLESRVQQLKPL